jgi:hypothetical protein
MGDGLAATLADAGTQKYDASKNTVTHSYAGKGPAKTKSATIKQKKKD